jgi:CDP-diacylglycerol--serine O-phosphatidyltransferase
VPFIWIPAVVLIIVALYINTPIVLFAIAALYVVSGPVMTLTGRLRHRGRRATRSAERRET